MNYDGLLWGTAALIVGGSEANAGFAEEYHFLPPLQAKQACRPCLRGGGEKVSGEMEGAASEVRAVGQFVGKAI